MYLLFRSISRNYDGYAGFTPVMAGSTWFGVAKEPATLGKKLVKLDGVEEIDEEEFNKLKKKVNDEAIAYRQPVAAHINPAKNPNAVYAEKPADGTEQGTSDPKDLLTIEEVEVDRPLEDSPPKRARKKGRFTPDDPSTPDVNEAWVGGRPPKKAKAPKKSPAKKRAKAK